MERNHTWAINTEEKYDVSEDSFLFTQFLASEADQRERDGKLNKHSKISNIFTIYMYHQLNVFIFFFFCLEQSIERLT